MSWLSNNAGSLIGVAGDLLGGGLSAYNSKKIAAMNMAMQREFAQNGIRWRVEDAKRAGVHPLYALGANGASFTPVSGYTGDYGVGDALSSLGQSIDRAKQAKMTPAEKAVQKYKAEKSYELDVKQKEANIAATMAQASYYSRLGQQQVPAMPGTETKAIDGQGNSTYGVSSKIGKLGQWVEAPNGGYAFLPNEDYLDYYSEGYLQQGQFGMMSTESFRKGLLKPPFPAKKGYKWEIDAATGTIIQVPIDKKINSVNDFSKPWLYYYQR